MGLDGSEMLHFVQSTIKCLENVYLYKEGNNYYNYFSQVEPCYAPITEKYLLEHIDKKFSDSLS